MANGRFRVAAAQRSLGFSVEWQCEEKLVQWTGSKLFRRNRSWPDWQVFKNVVAQVRVGLKVRIEHQSGLRGLSRIASAGKTCSLRTSQARRQVQRTQGDFAEGFDEDTCSAGRRPCRCAGSGNRFVHIGALDSMMPRRRP